MAKKQVTFETVKTPATIALEMFSPTVENETLMESCRDDLPHVEEPDMLVFLVTRQPGLYATFIGKLICGSSPKAAALCIGQPYQRINAWFHKGSVDLAADLDTYCGRFLLDCQRAYAMAISYAEEKVFNKDPERWLSRGHAKTFYDGKYWTDQHQQQVEGESENPLEPSAISYSDEGVVELAEDNPELAEAIKLLEHHQIITNPAFVKAAKNQYKIDENKS